MRRALQKTFLSFALAVQQGDSMLILDFYKIYHQDMGVAIVIVNHLRTVATLLHEILPHHTKMPVELITERLDIQPNHVFIIPEKRN